MDRRADGQGCTSSWECRDALYCSLHGVCSSSSGSISNITQQLVGDAFTTPGFLVPFVLLLVVFVLAVALLAWCVFYGRNGGVGGRGRGGGRGGGRSGGRGRDHGPTSSSRWSSSAGDQDDFVMTTTTTFGTFGTYPVASLFVAPPPRYETAVGGGDDGGGDGSGGAPAYPREVAHVEGSPQ